MFVNTTGAILGESLLAVNEPRNTLPLKLSTLIVSFVVASNQIDQTNPEPGTLTSPARATSNDSSEVATAS